MRWRRILPAIMVASSLLAFSAGGARPAPALTEDRGKFRVLLEGQPMGTEEFSIGRSGPVWVCRGSVELKIPGAGAASVSSQMHLAENGAPQQYAWTSKTDKKVTGGVVFTGGNAQLEVRVEGAAPYAQEFQFESAKIIILDNNLFHHYLILAQLYDWNAKGTQTFSVLIPQALTPGTITVESGGTAQLDGVKYDLLRVRTPDLEVELYLTAGKLMRLEVPSAKVSVQRE